MDTDTTPRYRLAITGTGVLLHLALHETPRDALCGLPGMCTAAGYGTPDNPRSPIHRRCLEVRAEMDELAAEAAAGA